MFTAAQKLHRWFSALTHTVTQTQNNALHKSRTKYHLPGTPINRDVSERRRLTLPQDGSSTHTVHCTPPEDEIENVRIRTRPNGSWEQAGCESSGTI